MPREEQGSFSPPFSGQFQAALYNSGTLTPKGTITERAGQGVDVYRKRRPPGSKSDRKDRRGKGSGRASATQVSSLRTDGRAKGWPIHHPA